MAVGCNIALGHIPPLGRFAAQIACRATDALQPLSGVTRISPRIAINQQRQHHPRMILHLARPGPTDVRERNINPFSSRIDEVCQIIIPNPVPQVRLYKQPLRAVRISKIAHT